MTVDEALALAYVERDARGPLKKPRSKALVMETLADEVHRQRAERAELDAATTQLLEVAEKMADGCTVGNFGPLQNRLRARSKTVRALRAKLGIKL